MTRLSRFVLAPHPNPFGEKHGFYTTSWDLTLDCLQVRPTKGELLKASGIRTTANGTFSRKQREALIRNLDLAQSLGLVSISEPLAQWKRGRQAIQLNNAYYGGLRKGGHGFSIVNGERLLAVIRKAMQPGSRNLCAVPLICFLLRQQSRQNGRYRPAREVSISPERLVSKLGFHSANTKRHLEALNSALTFLVHEDVLCAIPIESPAAFGSGTVLRLKKNPKFFYFEARDQQLSEEAASKNVGGVSDVKAPINPILVNPRRTAGPLKRAHWVTPSKPPEPQTQD